MMGCDDCTISATPDPSALPLKPSAICLCLLRSVLHQVSWEVALKAIADKMATVPGSKMKVGALGRGRVE